MNHLNREQDGAWCSTLKIGKITILLDCGAPETNFDLVAAHCTGVDYILLSHASVNMIGALPYLQKLGLLENVQILGTLPVAKLGAQSLFEFVI